jgi:hypothetical protein
MKGKPMATSKPDNDSAELTDLLHAHGYKTVEGADAVLKAIAAASDGSTQLLCSGYRVFPDGAKCPGCADCNQSE